MLDWIGRTLLLVLAGLSTFAVIASLMAASVLAPPGAVPETAVGTGDPIAGDARPVAENRPAPDTAPQSDAAAGDAVAVVAQMPADPAQHWLEALTWAMLALAGFAAASLLVLLRITFHLSVIARSRN